ncbi:MAG: hypothetical protein ACKO1V_02705, partial [Cyanobium sp.]
GLVITRNTDIHPPPVVLATPAVVQADTFHSPSGHSAMDGNTLTGTGIQLTVSQQFEIERFNRAIDATADPEELRNLAKQLLQAWQSQKAATTWAINQQMGL